MDEGSKSVKSNEEIIDELTKDLEGSCIRPHEKSVPSNDNNAKSNVKSGEVSDNSSEFLESNSENEEKCETGSTHDASRPTDLMDEELLKDRELTLTDSEREKLKDEAETLKNEGNDLFRSGDYIQAVSRYTQGIQTCPLAYDKERSILYANRAAAKSKCLEKDSAISDCTKAIELNPSYIKAYIRRGQLYEETEKLDEALEDFKKVLTFDPTHMEANYALRRLPPLIQEKNEKLKTEMLGKLKDLGDMVLKPFGLSTNNFELQKDPNSGGYSFKFNQSPT